MRNKDVYCYEGCPPDCSVPATQSWGSRKQIKHYCGPGPPRRGWCLLTVQRSLRGADQKDEPSLWPLARRGKGILRMQIGQEKKTRRCTYHQAGRGGQLASDHGKDQPGDAKDQQFRSTIQPDNTSRESSPVLTRVLSVKSNQLYTISDLINSAKCVTRTVS